MEPILRVEGVYEGAEGRLSPYDLHCTTTPRPAGPLVVFAHGYKGFKDWGCWNGVAAAFARSGIDFFKFNFSHNGGTVADPIDFPDLEAFAKNTYSKEVGDLHLVLDHIGAGIEVASKRRTWRKIVLIGHSRGGGIANLVASQRPEVKGLVTWAAVADFGARFSFDMEAWKATGVATVLNGRTGQEMPHSYSFYEDYRQNESSLHILASAKEVGVPALVVHGLEDEAVTFDNAERLASALPKAQLWRINGGGHTFGARHPWPSQGLPVQLQEVVEVTASFVLKI